MNDKQIHAWIGRINEVLFREWAPLGEGVPEDEYMGYAPAFAGMLLQHAPDSELFAHLEWAEVENIGLGGPFDRERAEKVIAALKALGVPGRP